MSWGGVAREPQGDAEASGGCGRDRSERAGDPEAFRAWLDRRPDGTLGPRGLGSRNLGGDPSCGRVCVTAIVIDASAGVELGADTDTVRGRRLRRLVPPGSDPWVPDHFYVECAAVLHRWDLSGHSPPSRIETALRQLLTWPLRSSRHARSDLSGLGGPGELTIADGVYVALALHLGAPLLDECKAGWCPQLTCHDSPVSGRLPARTEASPAPDSGPAGMVIAR